MSTKQDLNGVRTAQDLERKYDFASLLGLKKNIEIQAKSLIKLDNELNSILNTLIIKKDTEAFKVTVMNEDPKAAEPDPGKRSHYRPDRKCVS